MIPKMIALALAGTLTVWSIGCKSEGEGTDEEPGSPPAQNEPGSPPDTKGGSGTKGSSEPGS